MGEIGTKPSFGQSVVNVGFRMNWLFAELPRSAWQRASLHGSDFAGIGSHAKIVAAASLTKNPISEVVAPFDNPTRYFAQWCKRGEPTPPRAPPFSRIRSVLGRQTSVSRQGSARKSGGPLSLNFDHSEKSRPLLKADILNRGCDASCPAKIRGPAEASQPFGFDQDAHRFRASFHDSQLWYAEPSLSI